MTSPAPGQAGPPNPGAPEQSPLRSIYTNNFPKILERLGISLVVSTYQAGRVILIRNDGGTINTHFKIFEKPMGIAVEGPQGLAIGSAKSVWYLRNMPALAAKLEPPGKHDACYLPRGIHTSGDIDIHEMAFDAEQELWAVNTKFGCLCTFEREHSFNPRWKPPFLSAYAPEDRCHLNGLAMQDGKPKYVTALGQADTPGGWRENKARGGILMDVETDEILLQGLSMPHSPRVYQERLWFLESGEGSLAKVDLERKTWITSVQLPGFTRGIDFVGPLAFIGLSQVRESAVFSGIPLVDRIPVEERACGVWVVNIETAETLAFLRFEEGVQEIFAVQVLPNSRYPEILDWNDDRLRNAYVLPDEALEIVPEQIKDPAAGGMSPGPFMEAYVEALRLRDHMRYPEAIQTFKEALKHEPENAVALNDLGNAYAALNDLDGASKFYRKALRVDSEMAVAHLNLGITALKKGDYARGFKEIDWRWKAAAARRFQSSQPEWRGEDLSGKTLLVAVEPAASDAWMFARYIPVLADMADRLIVAAPQALHEVLAGLAGIDLLTGPEEPDEPYDCFAMLSSLPRWLDTSIETIPSSTDAYVLAPAERALEIEVDPERPFKLGFAWATGPEEGDDPNRSTIPETFTPLLGVEGVRFYSLQMGPRAQEFQRIPGHLAVTDLGPQLKGWADMAAAIDQMDLIISVDTGLVHLAGAMAKPTWVMLPQVADWRWLLERDDSPWYGSLRLFRQARPRDWASLTVEVAAALQEQRSQAS